MAVRNALIVTNTIGMFHFLWSDIDMLNQMGYRVFAMATIAPGRSILSA